MVRKFSLWLVLASVLVCLLGVLSVDYWLGRRRPHGPSPLRTPFVSRREVPRAETRAPAARIGPQTIIEVKTIYTLCGHAHTLQLPPTEMLGWDREKLQKVHPDWEITLFTPRRVAAVARVQGLDAECANSRYLGIRGAYVAVFRGKPRFRVGEGVLERLTEIKVANLPESEIKALRDGITVTSEEELLQILEGLAEGQGEAGTVPGGRDAAPEEQE